MDEVLGNVRREKKGAGAQMLLPLLLLLLLLLLLSLSLCVGVCRVTTLDDGQDEDEEI